MTLIKKMMIDRDPMLMANLVMSDPNHQARAKARTEQARKCYQSKAERELQEVKAEREKDRRGFQEYIMRMTIDHNTTAAIIAVGALMGGYILTLL